MTTTAVVLLNENAARSLTERIRTTTEELGSMLLEAYEGEAWRALGYESWPAYIEAEFEFTKSRSYQLLDQQRVARLVGAAEYSPLDSPITERDVRAVKRLARERDVPVAALPPVDAVEVITTQRTVAIQRVRNGAEAFPADSFDEGAAIYRCRHCQRTGTIEQLARCFEVVRGEQEQWG